MNILNVLYSRETINWHKGIHNKFRPLNCKNGYFVTTSNQKECYKTSAVLLHFNIRCFMCIQEQFPMYSLITTWWSSLWFWVEKDNPFLQFSSPSYLSGQFFRTILFDINCDYANVCKYCKTNRLYSRYRFIFVLICCI